MKSLELVGRKLNRTNSLIVAEAYRRGVEFEILPKQRFKMSYGGKSYIIKRGQITASLNTILGRRIANMKEVTSRLLRSKGFNSPENTVFSKHDLERAWEWAKPILPVVLKPYDGMMGRLVFVNIDNYDEFKDCFERVVEKHDEILIEKFVEGTEYRFTYIRNEIVAIAKRVPANVIGDGVNTIEALINAKNEERKKNPIHKKIELDKESERVLTRQGLSFDHIPKEGETVYLRNNSNVSTGGDAIDVTDEISTEIKEYVRKAIRTNGGLVACGADILINGDEVNVIEINPYPMIIMHIYPWEGKSIDVIGKVVDGMFPQTIE